MKYYAVKTNDENKIFTSWDECSLFLKGKKQILYKAFKTEEEAKDFICGKEELPKHDIPTAYIDGSYDGNTGRYSFGGVLIIGNEILSFNKAYDKDEYSSARNVAGEIKGAGYIIKYCINRNIKELTIYYDYIGIEKWFTKEWKASSDIAKVYVDFVDGIREKIKIHFVKVKSHSNDLYNDQADALAKAALGLK